MVRINGSSAAVGYETIKGYVNDVRIYEQSCASTNVDNIKLNKFIARLLFTKSR